MHKFAKAANTTHIKQLKGLTSNNKNTSDSRHKTLDRTTSFINKNANNWLEEKSSLFSLISTNRNASSRDYSDKKYFHAKKPGWFKIRF